MSNLVTINYNLTTEIERQLNEIPLVVVTGDETLTLARLERTKLNKVIESFETERKGLNKAINDNFKIALKDAVERLSSFDENIRTGAEEQRVRRIKQIKDDIVAVSKNSLNPDNAPIDDFLKAFDSRKKQIELWVSKTKSEIETISATLGQKAVDDFHEHYRLMVTLSRFSPKTEDGHAPQESFTTSGATYSSLTITVNNDIKDEIVAYLESRGVLVG